jgi:hypothetical protein
MGVQKTGGEKHENPPNGDLRLGAKGTVPLIECTPQKPYGKVSIGRNTFGGLEIFWA